MYVYDKTSPVQINGGGEIGLIKEKIAITTLENE
jgi:hypothetical protein